MHLCVYGSKEVCIHSSKPYKHASEMLQTDRISDCIDFYANSHNAKPDHLSLCSGTSILSLLHLCGSQPVSCFVGQQVCSFLWTCVSKFVSINFYCLFCADMFLYFAAIDFMPCSNVHIHVYTCVQLLHYAKLHPCTCTENYVLYWFQITCICAITYVIFYSSSPKLWLIPL